MTILITGGGSGIGAATARRMAKQGRVLVTDIDEVAAENVASRIRRDGGDAGSAHVNVTDAKAIREAVAHESRSHPIDGLFCNAGLNRRFRVEEISAQDWREMMAVNVKGAFLCAQAVMPAMWAARRGVILLMSSDFAVMGMPAAPAYAAAKTAVYSLTKTLALECAPYGVRVNALGPGPIDTPLLRGGRVGAEWEAAEQKLLSGIPMGRLGQPEEVAALAAFLSSDRSSYMTGQIVHPNGGQLTW